MTASWEQSNVKLELSERTRLTTDSCLKKQAHLPVSPRRPRMLYGSAWLVLSSVLIATVVAMTVVSLQKPETSVMYESSQASLGNFEFTQPQDTSKDHDNYTVAPVSVNATYDLVNHTSIVYGQGLANCTDHTDAATCTPMNLTLDIWEPIAKTENGKRRPAMILIHGGSYSGGDATMDGMGSDGPWFARRGWVTFSINYRLVGDHGLMPTGFNVQNTLREWVNESNFIAIFGWMYPAVRDAKASVRYVRANADRYHIDPERITVLGGSAGACAAIAIGATFETDYFVELENHDLTLATTNPTISSRVRNVISHWGCLDAVFAVTWRDGVERWRHDYMAPVAAYAGTNDTEVYHGNSEYLCEMYNHKGIDCHLVLLDGWGHDCWNARIFPKDLDVRGDVAPTNISQNEDSFYFLVVQQQLPIVD